MNIIQTNSKENAKKIKLATSWERGADGKWSYEVTEIELLDGSGIPHTQSADFIPTSNNSITLAKLLKGVKKSKELNRFYLHEVVLQKSLLNGVSRPV